MPTTYWGKVDYRASEKMTEEMEKENEKEE